MVVDVCVCVCMCVSVCVCLCVCVCVCVCVHNIYIAWHVSSRLLVALQFQTQLSFMFCEFVFIYVLFVYERYGSLGPTLISFLHLGTSLAGFSASYHNTTNRKFVHVLNTTTVHTTVLKQFVHLNEALNLRNP